MNVRRPPNNYALLFPYALPFFVYVLVLSRGQGPLGDAVAYALAALATLAALVWSRRWLLPLRGAKSPALSVAAGGIAGIAGTALWVLLKTPFVEAGEAQNEAWAPSAFWWRIGVSSLVVPFVEEWLFRGLVFRGATQWLLARRAGAPDPLGRVLHGESIHELSPEKWTAFGLVFSSVVFAAGHAPSEWIAATAYGLLMGGLVIARGDLIGAVVAHGVTNATLALYVRHSGEWALW